MYHFYITRSASWEQDNDPITIHEVDELSYELPLGFEIDWEGVVEVRTPYGVSTEQLGPCVFYQDYYNANHRVYIRFQDDVPSFSLEDTAELYPFLELAELLHARIMDENGEVYTESDI
ncbi:MAG: hypothetical protein MJ071_04985 [Oscillospiraceae bacterium]|nr:hypothetical protein [Oscillospiraceae bacterium]